MNELIIAIAGWIPAIILPLATVMQLLKIIQAGSVSGVSLFSWLLFGIANAGLYIFTEKYGSPQAILGLMLTSVLDFIIVGLLVFKKSYSGRNQ